MPTLPLGSGSISMLKPTTPMSSPSRGGIFTSSRPPSAMEARFDEEVGIHSVHVGGGGRGGGEAVPAAAEYLRQVDHPAPWRHGLMRRWVTTCIKILENKDFKPMEQSRLNAKSHRALRCFANCLMLLFCHHFHSNGIQANYQ